MLSVSCLSLGNVIIRLTEQPGLFGFPHYIDESLRTNDLFRHVLLLSFHAGALYFLELSWLRVRLRLWPKTSRFELDM